MASKRRMTPARNKTQATALSAKEREKIFDKLRSDPKFRERLKKDWRKAVASIGVKPEKLADAELRQSEMIPSKPTRAATIHTGLITITIFDARSKNTERIRLEDAVVFKQRTRAGAD